MFFHYLSGTKSYSLYFVAGSSKTVGCCNAEYAGDAEDRRSSTVYEFIQRLSAGDPHRLRTQRFSTLLPC